MSDATTTETAESDVGGHVVSHDIAEELGFRAVHD
jgi:hypothetical protein